MKKNNFENKEFLKALRIVSALGYLNKDELRLWLWIFAHGGEIRGTWQREIARDIRMHRAALNRAIKRLTEMGLISRVDEEVDVMATPIAEGGIKRIWLRLAISVEGTIAHAAWLNANYAALEAQAVIDRLGTLEESQKRYDEAGGMAAIREEWSRIVAANPEDEAVLSEMSLETVMGDDGKPLATPDHMEMLEVTNPRGWPSDKHKIAAAVWLSDHYAEWYYAEHAETVRREFADHGYWEAYRHSLGLKSGCQRHFEASAPLLQFK